MAWPCAAVRTPYWRLLLGLTLALLWLPPPAHVTAEVFTSTESLRHLVSHQGALLTSLQEYVQREEGRLSQMRRLIAVKQEDTESMNLQAALTDVLHPVTAYTLVRDWASVSHLVHDDSAREELLTRISQGRIPLPDKNDLKGARQSLIRVQRVYNLPIEELARGEVREHVSTSHLGARDLYEVGRLALDERSLRAALPWFQAAITCRSRDQSRDFSPAELMHRLASVFHEVSDTDLASEFLESAGKLEKSTDSLDDEYQKMIRLLEKKRKVTRPPPTMVMQLDEYSGYQQLCRRKLLQPGAYMTDSWCAYQSHLVAYAPYKMEVMNTDPWIVMYYDVISDSESEEFKGLAQSEMGRALVYNGGTGHVTDGRVGKLSRLWDDKNSFAKKMSARAGHVTGLDTTYFSNSSNSDAFEVLNYGMGGHYAAHLDVHQLSDVTEGGATVFPHLNVNVPPVKNAAAFWYNIHRNGFPDLRTVHAGCPVLVGEKWIANKWIRERGQLFRRPCGPDFMATELESQPRTAGF